MSARHWMMAAGLALVAACGTDEDGNDVDAGADTGLQLDATGADTVEVDEGPIGVCGPLAPTRVFVVSELEFVGEEGGVTRGFDVDGFVSNGADPNGCRKVDLVDAEGNEGVDNQFAYILPIIESTGGQALPGLIQNAINEGDILIVFEVESAEDLANDQCVSLSIGRGEGAPFVDANGRIGDGQTFDRNLEIAPGRFEEARIEDGVLRAGPMSFTVPAYVFFFSFLLPIDAGIVEMTFAEDGTVSGVMGGAIAVEALEEQFGDVEGDGGATDAVLAVLPSFADLFPDENGACTAVSASLAFRAVPAFYYE